MLDANLKSQLKGYLERIIEPAQISANLGDDASSRELRGLLEDIVSLSDRISLRFDPQNGARLRGRP